MKWKVACTFPNGGCNLNHLSKNVQLQTSKLEGNAAGILQLEHVHFRCAEADTIVKLIHSVYFQKKL